MQKFIVSVSAVVYNEKNELLITERSDKELQGAGLFSYPGGKVENFKVSSKEEVKHSILEETIKRELFEECGVKVEDNLRIINNHAFQRFDGKYCIMIIFLAKLKKQKKIKLDKSEIKKIHWKLFGEIDREKMYEPVYEVYKLANDLIRKRQRANETVK